jgi:hypothetical protein
MSKRRESRVFGGGSVQMAGRRPSFMPMRSCSACGTRNPAAGVLWVVWTVHDDQCEAAYQGLQTRRYEGGDYPACKCPGSGAFLCADHRQAQLL